MTLLVIWTAIGSSVALLTLLGAIARAVMGLAVTLARIEEKMDGLGQEVERIREGDAPACAAHERRISALEARTVRAAR